MVTHFRIATGRGTALPKGLALISPMLWLGQAPDSLVISSKMVLFPDSIHLCSIGPHHANIQEEISVDLSSPFHDLGA